MPKSTPLVCLTCATLYEHSPAPPNTPDMVGHASWYTAYDTEELYSWFMQRKDVSSSRGS